VQKLIAIPNQCWEKWAYEFHKRRLTPHEGVQAHFLQGVFIQRDLDE
jgi:hypothetical protein